MKIMIHLLLIFLPLSLCHAGFDIPHVVVYGTGKIEVVPDELHWNISLKTLEGTVVEVSKNHIEDVSSVLNYLNKSGLSADDVKTSNMQLNENVVYRNNSRLKEGYFAFTSISFKTTTESHSYLEYWNQLASFNNLTINSVVFALSNRIAIQDKTRIIAVKNAKEKAMSLASALGVQVLEPLLIEEIDSFSGSPRNAVRSMEMVGARDNAASISPGKETVQAKVKALFRISDR